MFCENKLTSVDVGGSWGGGQGMCGLEGANPFQIDGPPRRRQDFVGRSREVRRVLEFLGKGQSVSIVGSEGCGKTWLLDHVADVTVYEQHGLRAGEHVFVRINGRAFADVDQVTCLHGFHREIASHRDSRGFECRWTFRSGVEVGGVRSHHCRGGCR